MTDYLRIARAYLCGASAAVWCFMFFCLFTFSAVGEDLARNQGGILDGVISRKSYMAMFAYFNACILGVLLRDNIAHLWASVLPYYRQKHLLVTALIAVVFIGVPMLSMQFVGTSDIAPTSVAVIFLTCLAAGLWTLHHPLLGGFLVLPFLVFAFGRSSSSPALVAFLAGTNPVASAVLGFISLLALAALAWRLLELKEEMSEYAIARLWGDFLRGRGFQGQAKTFLAALPADQQANFQNAGLLENPFSNLRQVDNLTGYSERTLWQRLQLWRLGTAPTRTSTYVAFLMVLTLLIIPPMVLIPSLAGPENQARNTVVIFSVQVMTNPVIFWFSWFTRIHRLGYESLRPRTRPEFVRELGLTLSWDIVQCWLAGMLFLGIAAALWAPELLEVKNLLLFIIGTAVGQLCAYAMYALVGIWLLKRGTVASLLCALCQLLAMETWMLFIVQPISVEANLVIASVLAVASVAAIALAYRRWCRADLD